MKQFVNFLRAVQKMAGFKLLRCGSFGYKSVFMQERYYSKMVLARKYIYAKPFEGMPTEENVKIVEEELPELNDGEYLVEAVYLSVDPYMRAYAPSYKIGDTMIGSQVAKIIQSKSSKFPVGKYVVGAFGWSSHSIGKDDEPVTGWQTPHIVPFEPTDKIPISYALGVLGMPGCTAHLGLMEVCNPKPGETVVVSGAAGAVGSIVGQIAKIKGCTVIGIAGSDEKGKWLKSLGYDHVINYKTQDLEKALAEAATKGVDCYYDNVGGETSSIVLHKMNRYGRVAVCGAIAGYNSIGGYPKATMVQRPMISFELTMRGFLVNQFLDKWNDTILQNLKWVQEGKLKYNETLTVGFENMLKGLIGVLNGENIGKAIVKY